MLLQGLDQCNFKEEPELFPGEISGDWAVPKAGSGQGQLSLSLSRCGTKLSLQAGPCYSFTNTGDRSTFKNYVVNLAF